MMQKMDWWRLYWGSQWDKFILSKDKVLVKLSWNTCTKASKESYESEIIIGRMRLYVVVNPKP